jgi:hypothetical protein
VVAAQWFPYPQVAVRLACCCHGDSAAGSRQHRDPDDLAVCWVREQRITEPHAEGFPRGHGAVAVGQQDRLAAAQARGRGGSGGDPSMAGCGELALG